jgi:hypothetical protein
VPEIDALDYFPLTLPFYLGLAATVTLLVVLAAVCHLLARPVQGIMGIAIPTLVPPVLASLVATLLSWRRAAPLASISGSLGTLIGADLLNLDKIQALGAPPLRNRRGRHVRRDFPRRYPGRAADRWPHAHRRGRPRPADFRHDVTPVILDLPAICRAARPGRHSQRGVVSR